MRLKNPSLLSRAILPALISLVSFAACEGMIQAPVEGRLEVYPGRRLELRDRRDGMPVEAGSGSASFLVENRGVLLSSDLVLRMDGREFLFKVPRSAFVSETSFIALPSDTGQPVEARGHRESVLRSTEDIEESHVCNGPGICNACGPRVDSEGKVVTDCAWGYHLNCMGREKVLMRHDTYQDAFVADFFSPDGSGRRLGRFTGKGDSREETKVLSSEGCKI